MEEFDGLAEQQRVKPQAAAGTGSERRVKGDAHQAGADTRACQVLYESIGHGLEDARVAGAPQHCCITCEEQKRD